jgi:putative ABC transport system substrate-binding protein
LTQDPRLPHHPGVNRRRFLLTSLGGALALPRLAEAQKAGKVGRVAYVVTTTPVAQMAGAKPSHPPTRYLLEELGALGWIEGQNLIVERRSAEGRFERFGAILRELVDLPCDVIVTTGQTMTEEALRVTKSVPIVITAVDPIAAKLATTIARPDRNVTGMMGPGPDFEGKKLEWLREALPQARRVAVLTAAGNWTGSYGQAMRDAAVKLRITLLYTESGPKDYARAFAAIKQERPDALFVAAGGYLFADRYSIIQFASQNRLPLFGQNRDFVQDGALLTYQGSTTAFWQRTASYVDRLLRGARTADLPIEEIDRFELVINLKTAKALGLTIPPSLLARADQVIE